MSFLDLPAHVAHEILRRLNSRDLCYLRATCRAFEFSLVETAALEALRARAPWLAEPSSKTFLNNETWLDLLRFAELASALKLPKLTAAEDTTVVVDRLGRLHVWGGVVDAQGDELSDTEGGTEVEDDERKKETSKDKKTSKKKKIPVNRVLTASGGYACTLGGGAHGGSVKVIRNVPGVDTSRVWGSPTLNGRPPTSPIQSFASPSASLSGIETPGSSGSHFSSVNGASPVRLNTHSEHGNFTALLSPLKGYGLFGGARVVSIAIGRMHALCATVHGEVYSWGNDAAGQLGHGGSFETTALERLAIGGSFNSPKGNGPMYSQSFGGYVNGTEFMSGSPRSRDRRRQKSRDRTRDDSAGGGSPRSQNFEKFFPSASGSEFFPGSSNNYDNRSSAFGNNSRSSTHNSTHHRSQPRRVCSTLGTEKIISVSAARHSSAALSSSGVLFTWGSNRCGTLGLGDDIDRDVPMKVEVGVRGEGGCDFDSENNSENDSENDSDNSPEQSPVIRNTGNTPQRFPGAMSDTDDDEDDFNWKFSTKGKETLSPRNPNRKPTIVRFAFGARHAAAVTNAGKLVTWGDNRLWQCGRRSSREPEFVLWPKAVDLPLGSSDEESDDDDEDAPPEQRSNERTFSDGVTNSGSRGTSNLSRAMFSGEKRFTYQTRPRRRGPLIVDTACGASHTVCVDTFGKVWTFGTGHGLAPGDPIDGYDETMYDQVEGHQRRPPERARGVPRATAVAAGSRHTAIFVAKTNCSMQRQSDSFFSDKNDTCTTYDVYTWGANEFGQLGPKAGDDAPIRPTPTLVALFQSSELLSPP